MIQKRHVTAGSRLLAPNAQSGAVNVANELCGSRAEVGMYFPNWQLVNGLIARFSTKEALTVRRLREQSSEELTTCIWFTLRVNLYSAIKYASNDARTNMLSRVFGICSL